MDVKGQYECERYFLIFMWICTGVSFACGLIADDVYVMFGLFAVTSGIAFAIFVPDLRWFNKTPLQFRQRPVSKIN
jgi:Microsomal signal peptidase 12 kDa subunit (SPC12)